MKLSDVLAKTLIKYKIKNVFGLQGGAVVHIFDSLEKYNINVVYTLHEQTASLAASANSKIEESKFGVCVVTSGPGATNAITGLLGAWNDSTPCLFISGQVRSSHVSYGKKVRQFGTQEAPICDIVKPIVKHSYYVDNPKDFQKKLENSIQIATSGRPGPVWIDIPLEFQWVDVDYNLNYKVRRKKLEKASKKIQKFENLLSESKQPLIIVGNGVRLSLSTKLLKKFISIHNLPFVTTWTSQDNYD
jgi:Thiamine pyrophosphate-requiring enzymes [acetolactate synthase, pyruvate dehydrogenase (cytochrome), glyoxylate carboligase, phosphonopyruvate decarboxylase]